MLGILNSFEYTAADEHHVPFETVRLCRAILTGLTGSHKSASALRLLSYNTHCTTTQQYRGLTFEPGTINLFMARGTVQIRILKLRYWEH